MMLDPSPFIGSFTVFTAVGQRAVFTMILLAGLAVSMTAAGIRAFTDCFDLFGHIFHLVHQ